MSYQHTISPPQFSPRRHVVNVGAVRLWYIRYSDNFCHINIKLFRLGLLFQTAEDEVQRLQGTLMAMDQVLNDDGIGTGGITSAFSFRRALKPCCPCALTSGHKPDALQIVWWVI